MGVEFFFKRLYQYVRYDTFFLEAHVDKETRKLVRVAIGSKKSSDTLIPLEKFCKIAFGQQWLLQDLFCCNYIDTLSGAFARVITKRDQEIKDLFIAELIDLLLSAAARKIQEPFLANKYWSAAQRIHEVFLLYQAEKERTYAF